MTDLHIIRDPWLRTGLGLCLLAVLSLPPLLFRELPVEPVAGYDSALAGWLVRISVLVLMLLAMACAARKASSLTWLALLALFAGLMTSTHGLLVDRAWPQWPAQHYLDVLNNRIDAPHPFRPLPYGFIRTLELLTGDWWFSNCAYRWFFNYWLLVASYRFARLFQAPGRSLLVVLIVTLLYPFSVLYYMGQPTDPMSHTLFVLAMIYAVENRPAGLAAALGLGVMAKETAVVLVPGYWACQWRSGWRAFLCTVLLGLVCLAAFVAVRLPLGWRPGNRTINGLDDLMIGTNLGIGEPIAWSSVPQYENYLQPLLFIGSFLPFIAWQWRRLDPRLKGLFLTVPPMVVLSSLCFSWLYESRNYVPLLPLLATMALPSAPYHNPADH